MSNTGPGRGRKHYTAIVIGDMSYGLVWMEDEYHTAPFASGKYPIIPREKRANELDVDLDIQRDYYSDLGGEARGSVTDYAWTIEEARPFITRLEAVAVLLGYHVALAGSVLHQDKSTKDLDVVVYPHCKPEDTPARRQELLEAFAGVGLRLGASSEVMLRRWGSVGSRDTKHVEVWWTNDSPPKRVDFIFVA